MLFITLIATSGLWQDDESNSPVVRPTLFAPITLSGLE